MTKAIRVSFILLLSAPFLLGAVASKQRAAKKDVAVVQSVSQAVPKIQPEPTATAVPPTVESTTENTVDPIQAPSSSMANYAIDWYSINGGGTTNASSASYKMGASVGQSVAGAASSASYQMGIGFWYGASGSGGCACDCHGNPVCDAAICDVLDVVAAVTVAFRNGAALPDPNANCPYEKTDVDCSTFTDVIDVVKIVTVAFRNGNPATEFCNPCP